MARQGAASMLATALLLGVFANIAPSDSSLLSFHHNIVSLFFPY
jgi:hypothetical protein